MNYFNLLRQDEKIINKTTLNNQDGSLSFYMILEHTINKRIRFVTW